MGWGRSPGPVLLPQGWEGDSRHQAGFAALENPYRENRGAP